MPVGHAKKNMGATPLMRCYKCTMLHSLTLAILACLVCSEVAAGQGAAVDAYGDPLPPGAVTRLGTTRLWHPGTIGALAYSPDGKTLAAAQHSSLAVFASNGQSMTSQGRSIVLWDAVRGNPVREILTPFGGPRHLTYSRNGQYLASGFEKEICVWETATGKEVAKLQGADKLDFIGISPDGKQLAAGDAKQIIFWSLPEGKKLKEHRAPPPPDDTADRKWSHDCSGLSDDWSRLAWSYCAELIVPQEPGVLRAAQKLEHACTVCDIENHKIWQFFESLPTEAYSTAGPVFSPTGRLIVGMVNIWDIEKRAKHQRLPDDHFITVLFSPKGDLFVGSSGYRLHVVDVTSKQKAKEIHRVPPVWRIPFHAFWIHARPMCFTPDGSALAVGYSAIQVFDMTGKTASQPFGGFRDVVNYLQCSAGGETLITGGPASFHLPSPQSLTRWQEWKANPTASPVFGPRRKWPAMISPRHDVLVPRREGDNKKTVELVEISTGKTRWTVDSEHPSTVVLSPDGRMLVLLVEKDWRLLDAQTGREIRRIPGDGERPGDVGLSPDGKVLAWTGDRSGQLTLVDLTTGKTMSVFGEKGDDTYISSFAFSSDSKHFAFNLGEDPILHLVALNKSKPPRRLNPVPDREPAPWHPHLMFSADRRTIAMTRKNESDVELVEVLSGRRRATLIGHKADVAALLLSHDGRYLVSGSADTTALVWDLKDPLGKKRSQTLSTEQLTRCWEALAASDAEKAYDAVLDLIHAPAAAIAFLESKLVPAPVVGPKILASLISDLDSPQFALRNRAMNELEKHWDLCSGAIGDGLKQNPSLEVRRRLESLQEKIHGTPPADGLRNLRAVEVLEHIASPASRRLLERLAAGNPAARLTEEAREALERFKR